MAYESLAVVMNNPNLIQLFSQSSLQVNKTVLSQIFDSLVQITNGEGLDLSGEGSLKHMSSPHYSQ